jgi:peptide/nickel transport system ATP-binding protein
VSRPILEIEDLRVWFERRSGPTIHAVRGVSLAVRPGETLCVVGESGSGKTMTASALMRLLPAQARMSARALTLAGRDLAGLSERQLADIRGPEIGMVFQNPAAALNPAYTVGNQLEETYRRHRGGSRAEARERGLAMLARVGIPNGAERLNQYPHQLSGGLAQRVMIALALLCEPKVLIADEPTTALDVTTQAGILRLLADLQRDFGMALIMVTHDLRIVSRIADRVAVMYGGQIVEAGSRRDIFGDGAHPYTRALLDSIPGGGRDRLAVIAGAPPTITTDDALCAFRERCRSAQAACATDAVALTPFGPGRQVRCLYPVSVPEPRRASA